MNNYYILALLIFVIFTLKAQFTSHHVIRVIMVLTHLKLLIKVQKL